MVKKYQIEPPQLGIYITPETREAIKETAGKRDKERIAEIEQHLHDELDKCLRMIAVNEITGKDFIIYTPERAIGKTRALLENCLYSVRSGILQRRSCGFGVGTLRNQNARRNAGAYSMRKRGAGI